MIVPYKYRSRKIEQIMFRNLADRPLLYTLRIKRANGTEFSSEQTFEPRIVSPHLVTNGCSRLICRQRMTLSFGVNCVS